MISIEATAELLDPTDAPALYEASLSSALTTVFRGSFCDAILPGRASVTFKRDEVLYELGAEDRIFFFIRSGFIKIGTLTQDGREIIYDVRKEGGVAGELCACQSVRRDRAVALEPSEVIAVPYCEMRHSRRLRIISANSSKYSVTALRKLTNRSTRWPFTILRAD